MSCRWLAAGIVGCLAGCAGNQPAPDAQNPTHGETPAGSSITSAEVASARPGVAPSDSRDGSQPAPPVQRPINPEAVRIYRDGLSAAQSGNFGAAADRFSDAFKADPHFALAAYNLGLCQERMGQTARAKDAYRRALTAKPDLFEAAENLTRLQLRLGEASEAESELRARLAQPGAPPGLHTQLAEVLEAEGHSDAAAAEAKAALKADERNVPAMLELAHIYYDQRRFELSRMVVENVRQIDADNAEVYTLLGALDLNDKNNPMALEDFKKAADLREDLPEAQNNLGALLVATQDFPNAIKHLEIATRDSPAAVAPHLNLGNALRGAKQYDRAKAEYEKVLELDPHQIDAYFNLGVLYLDGEPGGMGAIDRCNQAIAYFDKFRASGGKDPKLDGYVKDAQKAIGQEKRHQEIEARNKLRKEAEDKKKAAAATAGSKLEEGGPLPGPGSAPGSKLQEPKGSSRSSPPGSSSAKLGGGK